MIVASRFVFRLVGVGTLGAILVLWCAVTPPVAAISEPESNDNEASELAPPVAAAATAATTSANVTVDLESKPLPRIPAGTEIGKTAPKGWSNFLMIAVPTLTEEDLADAPKIASHYAQMFKFTLLAQTERTKTGYQLKSVARGFAMNVRGKELIVESKRTFGGKVGVFGDRILAENEKHIEADVRQVARTPTLLLFDAQAVMRQGNDHVRMVLRHAVLVDPQSGKTYLFIWLLSKSRDDYAIAERELQFIPEGTREARYLSVKRDKIVLGIPTPEAFALVRTPQGKPIPWAKVPGLEKLAVVKKFTKEQVLDLEKQLLALGRSVLQ